MTSSSTLTPAGGRGGFVALAVLAAALGAGAAVLLAPDEGAKTRKRVGRGLRSLRGDAAERLAQLQREIRRRKNQSRREKQIIALAGLLIGAGLSRPCSTPASGAECAGGWAARWAGSRWGPSTASSASSRSGARAPAEEDREVRAFRSWAAIPIRSSSPPTAWLADRSNGVAPGLLHRHRLADRRHGDRHVARVAAPRRDEDAVLAQVMNCRPVPGADISSCCSNCTPFSCPFVRSVALQLDRLLGPGIVALDRAIADDAALDGVEGIRPDAEPRWCRSIPCRLALRPAAAPGTGCAG